MLFNKISNKNDLAVICERYADGKFKINSQYTMDSGKSVVYKSDNFEIIVMTGSIKNTAVFNMLGGLRNYDVASKFDVYVHQYGEEEHCIRTFDDAIKYLDPERVYNTYCLNDLRKYKNLRSRVETVKPNWKIYRNDDGCIIFYRPSGDHWQPVIISNNKKDAVMCGGFRGYHCLRDTCVAAGINYDNALNACRVLYNNHYTYENTLYNLKTNPLYSVKDKIKLMESYQKIGCVMDDYYGVVGVHFGTDQVYKSENLKMSSVTRLDRYFD